MYNAHVCVEPIGHAIESWDEWRFFLSLALLLTRWFMIAHAVFVLFEKHFVYESYSSSSSPYSSILKIGLFIVLVILFALHLVEIFNLLFRLTIFGCFGSAIEAIVVHYPRCLKMQDQRFFCASYHVDLHWKCVAKNTWIMLSSCYHHVVTYPSAHCVMATKSRATAVAGGTVAARVGGGRRGRGEGEEKSHAWLRDLIETFVRALCMSHIISQYVKSH